MIDSFELTKIAGGVLLALLLIFVPKTFIEIAQQSHHHTELKNGFTLPAASEAASAPGADGAPAQGGDAAPAAFDAAKVVASLKTANIENGKTIFRKCTTCHTADATSGSKAGPNLWGIVGRDHGKRADFPGYSEAMKNKPGPWTYEDLAHFIHKPKDYLPGTKMMFPGIADSTELADLLAYIHTLSDNPQPLP